MVSENIVCKPRVLDARWTMEAQGDIVNMVGYDLRQFFSIHSLPEISYHEQ